MISIGKSLIFSLNIVFCCFKVLQIYFNIFFDYDTKKIVLVIWFRLLSLHLEKFKNIFLSIYFSYNALKRLNFFYGH